jgi:hypothetical protein
MSSAELVMVWVVPGDSERREFGDRDAALARAWELTPAGGKRAEPVQDLSTREKASQGIPSKPRTFSGPPKKSSSVVAPVDPAVGDIWYDPHEGKVRVWRGKRWHDAELSDYDDKDLTATLPETISAAEWWPGDLSGEYTTKQIRAHMRKKLQTQAAAEGKVLAPETLLVKAKYDEKRDITNVTARCAVKDSSLTKEDEEKMRRDLERRIYAVTEMIDAGALTKEMMDDLKKVLKTGD